MSQTLQERLRVELLADEVKAYYLETGCTTTHIEEKFGIGPSPAKRFCDQALKEFAEKKLKNKQE